MFSRRLTVALLVLGAAGMTNRVAAQSCTGNPCSVGNTVSATVGTLLRLTLSTTTTALPAPSEAEFDAGFQDAAGPSATVKANRSWTLKVSAAAANWTTDNLVVKPAGDLQWATVAGGPYAGLAVAAADVASSGATASFAQAMFYRVLWSYANDAPGNYSLVVTYTVTAP
ncbi:MAG: hypothetical protein ACREMJ_10400 [Gemmatimonadales bacterium]